MLFFRLPAQAWRLAFAATLLLTVDQAGAAVPSTATLEGVLTSAGGGPAADGNYTLTVAIYPQQSGGTAAWTETAAVTAKGGQFTLQLGAKTPLSAAGLNLSSAWLGVAIGSDPELARQPLGSALYAQRAAVAESLDCSGCIKAGALEAAVLQPYAKATDLGNYAKAADLSGYAKTADLGGYAKATDLDAYAKVASLAAVAGSGSYNDLKDKPALADVAKTGNYGDLQNKPVTAKVGASCGSGLVLNGFKVDGSLDCGPLQVPADAIDEISNGLIWNQFIDSVSGGQKVKIIDGQGAGVSDTLSFPDIGLAQAIWVEFDIFNSDLTHITVELFGPGMSTPYILYSKSKSGQKMKVLFNKDTAIASGDMNKDWIGKNIKGNWSLTVKDPIKNQMNGTTDGDFSWALHIQTLSSKKVQVKGNLLVDGSVKIGSDAADCTALNAGAIRWTGNVFQGCNGKVWTGLQGADGSSPGSAAESCKTLHKEFPNLGDGVYWLDPNGGSASDAFQAPCNMTRDGGGWTMGVKMWYQAGHHGKASAVGSIGDALTLKGNPWKLSDAQIKGIIGDDNNFDVMFDQANYNSQYSSGNYEYAVIYNYTATWTWAGNVKGSSTTTSVKSYRISDGAVAWSGNFQCGDVGGWGINCYNVTAGSNPQGGAGCSINMGTASNGGWHHVYMAETNTDTYLYLCNGPQHSSSYNMNHRYWFR
ncbi:MAG: hypothetical protein FJ100_16120 [Deltaproteobacteria bacterium]|nr:hypothetical protein [Deltaproteobacteria bacterium]